MKKKILILSLAITLTITGAACGRADDTRSSGETKTLNDIRSETEKLRELDSEFQNLNLSETNLYVPDVDEISNFSLLPVPLSAEERETLLLETAEKFDGSKADAENIVYLSFDFETIPYSQAENDPDRGENYFIKYLTDDLDLGINIDGNYIYARKKEIAKIADWENDDYWVDIKNDPKEIYNLREEIPDIDIELRDGKQSFAETVEYMLDRLSDMPYYKNDKLTLCADEAQIYALGDSSAINVSFYYEHNGVPIDSYFRGYGLNIESGEHDSVRARLNSEASSVWTGSIDELYGAHMYAVEESTESNDKFIGLEDFLRTVSEKLTGNSIFNIESVELVYGLEYIFPEEFYSTPGAKAWEYTPEKLTAKPVWIAYIPNTGIADTPHMRIVADAVSGELELLA